LTIRSADLHDPSRSRITNLAHDGDRTGCGSIRKAQAEIPEIRCLYPSPQQPLRVSPGRKRAIQLPGFSGRRDDTYFDLEAFEANLSKVKRFCYAEKKFTVPVMQAFDQIFGRVK
jgi:hypothetical protein